ncbi:hypothetical protein GPALN_004223 [Globodera pallida]|nr:hypothetical protein GPALN_004223 [Globodera pallida]
MLRIFSFGELNALATVPPILSIFCSLPPSQAAVSVPAKCCPNCPSVNNSWLSDILHIGHDQAEVNHIMSLQIFIALIDKRMEYRKKHQLFKSIEFWQLVTFFDYRILRDAASPKSIAIDAKDQRIKLFQPHTKHIQLYIGQPRLIGDAGPARFEPAPSEEDCDLSAAP